MIKALGNDATFHWIKNIRHFHEFQNLIFAELNYTQP